MMETLYCFPWLSHGTTESTSDEERISIAFNIDLINLNTNMVNGLLKGSHIQTTTVEVSIKNELRTWIINYINQNTL